MWRIRLAAPHEQPGYVVTGFHWADEQTVRLLACGFVVASGGSAVFVDQSVQYGFSVDSLDIEVHSAIRQVS